MNSLTSSAPTRTSRRTWTNCILAMLTLSLASFATACSDPDKPANPSGAGGGSSSSGGGGGAAGAGGEGGGNGGSGGGGDTVEEPGPPEYVVKFDPAMGELPEGIAIDGTTAYVSFGSTKIIKVNLADGSRSDFGSIGVIGVASPQGLALDAQKNVYAAVASIDPVQFQPGIYKFPAAGGQPTLVGKDINMSFPRHIFFLSSGDAIISSPASSRLFVMGTDGTINQPPYGEWLAGDQSSGCAYGEGIPYGVTSAVVVNDLELFGTNADKASIFKGDINGTDIEFMSPFNIAGPDCGTFGGGESIVVDPVDTGITGLETTMFIAARQANKITRVKYLSDAEVTVVADDLNLFEPSALAIGVVSGVRYLYVVNSARTTFATGGIPSLVKMRIGTSK